MSIILTKLVLLMLSALGFYLTWYLLLHNGTHTQMVELRDVGPYLLPGTKIPLKTSYIGIGWLDYQLTVLDVFFWEVVDGSRPDASLFCYHFAGQAFVGWGLLMVESLRGGNVGRVISYIALWGIALQNLAFAVIMPIYLVLHLSSSPTVDSRKPSDYAVKTIDTLSIPVAMVLGYAIPTILMSLPAPSVLDFSTKQNFMAIWQFFPLWVAILHPIVAFLITSINNSKPRESATTLNATRKALRFVYLVLIISAGVNQLSTFSIVALSEFFPSIFALSYVGSFNFSTVFLPRSVTPTTKMSTIGDGALMLLQYDNYTGSSSIALWATVLVLQAYKNQERQIANNVTLVFYGFAALALTGPLGYAVACLWARDELVFENESNEKKAQ